MAHIVLDVPAYLDIIGEGKLDPVEIERRKDIVNSDGTMIGDAVGYKLLDKDGKVADYVWVYVPKKYLTPHDALSSGDATGGAKPDPHFGEITEIYFMTPDHGKLPKVSQWNDPDLTVMSMKNIAVDPDTFVAGMSDDDLPARYDYGVSLFNGADKIAGGEHGDQYIEVGAGGKAAVDSGDGNDTVYVWHRKNVDFDGGKGSDTLIFNNVVSGDSDTYPSVGATVDLGKGTATNPWDGAITLKNVENIVGYLNAANAIIGNNDANHITTGGFGDTVKGLGGNDVITAEAYFGDLGTARNMHLDGGKGIDTLLIRGIFGQSNTLDLKHPGDNTGAFATSTVKNFEIYKADNSGASLIFHGSGADEKVLTDPSATDNDVLDGRGGDDLLYAGGGSDTLTGGDGADRFRFKLATESTTSAPDTITDFSHAEHDKIDLHARYFGALHFIGNDAFRGHAGEIHAINQGSETLVEIDVDGNKTADFALLLDGAPTLVKDDFAL
jgi:Ca2+-binding RTX toxin-like protein